MSGGAIDLRTVKREARERAYTEPLEALNPAHPTLFEADAMWPYFERLRAEDPVHYAPEGYHAAHWAVTKFSDIIAVDSNHDVFSSEGGITLPPSRERAEKMRAGMQHGGLLTPKAGQESGGGPRMFIAMDPPKHDEQRKTVSPALSPHSLTAMEPLIRERAAGILDSLPLGEPFDWVDRVSKELTAMTLATLFGMPQEDRRLLTDWSDLMTNPRGRESKESSEHRRAEMFAYGSYFLGLWNDRLKAPPQGDLISMLAHSQATRNMNESEYLGNVVLLTIGGNDTTRNTISGSVYALNKFPDQYQKLRENPGLIPSMVSETIRWQTPLAHMRRTALVDHELGGKQIKAGDIVVMWYVSGNRDDQAIDNPNAYILDRDRPRHHLSFGFGIHRCVGNRVAELQLRVIWEEIIKRFPDIQITEEPTRTFSTFVRGYEQMMVVIPKRH